MKNSNPLIGAHVSAAGGVYKAVERAAGIGASCVQLFSGSPRVWKKADLSLLDTDKLFAAQEKYQISPIFIHALYLVNLASDKPDLIEKSLKSLEYELKFDALVKGAGVIVHLGSHQGRGWEVMRDQVAGHISSLLGKTPKNSTFIIENSAGQKGKLCSDLEDIRWLLDEINSPRLKWCFDTCHGFAGGYGLGQKLVIKEIERLKLWETLSCVHVNDSRDPFDSGRDRHANLGEGEIPKEDLRYFLANKNVRKVPLILEVPGFDPKKKGPDKENINRLKKLTE